MIFFFQGVGIIFGALGSILGKPTHESNLPPSLPYAFRNFQFFYLVVHLPRSCSETKQISKNCGLTLVAGNNVILLFFYLINSGQLILQ